MTTPEPRVRAVLVPVPNEETGLVDWHWRQWTCPACHHRSAFWNLDYDYRALTDAHRHAATCAALRLARLIRELEALRDGWTSKALYVDGSLLPPVSLERRIYRQAAADLTVIIDRAGRTG